MARPLTEYKELILKVLSCDTTTGVISWKVGGKNRKINTPINSFMKTGYLRVGLRLNGKCRSFKQHHLVWFFHTGEWPSEQIDHINNIKTDNRIENLRLATDQQNKRNVFRRGDYTSQYKGVCWSKQMKKWKAKIKTDDKSLHLGYFTSEVEAAKAYEKAAILYHKEFRRLQRNG